MSESAATPADTPDDNPNLAAQVGPAVEAIAYLLPGLPQETVRQFHAALGSRVALPANSVTRRERLRGLLDFIAARHRPPTRSEYVELCADATRTDRTYPPASTLEEYYGSYAAAINAAARLYARGTAAQVPMGQPKPRTRVCWTEAEALESLGRCRDTIGHWPSGPELAALRRTGEAMLVAHGWAGLRLPPDDTIVSLFGTHGEALRVAAERTEHAINTGGIEHVAPDEASASKPSSRKGKTVARRPRSERVRVPT